MGNIHKLGFLQYESVMHTLNTNVQTRVVAEVPLLIGFWLLFGCVV